MVVVQVELYLEEMRALIKRKLNSVGAPYDASFEQQLDSLERKINHVITLPRLRYTLL